jgi:hypothetical protein
MASQRCGHCGGTGRRELWGPEDNAPTKCSGCNGSGYIYVADSYQSGSGGGGSSTNGNMGCGPILVGGFFIMVIISFLNNKPGRQQNQADQDLAVPKPVAKNDDAFQFNPRPAPARRAEPPRARTIPIDPPKNRANSDRSPIPDRRIDRPREPRVAESTTPDVRERLEASHQLTAADRELLAGFNSKCKIIFKDFGGKMVETCSAKSKVRISGKDINLFLTLETEDDNIYIPTTMNIFLNSNDNSLGLQIQEGSTGYPTNRDCKYTIKNGTLYITVPNINTSHLKDIHKTTTYKFIDILKF